MFDFNFAAKKQFSPTPLRAFITRTPDSPDFSYYRADHAPNATLRDRRYASREAAIAALAGTVGEIMICDLHAPVDKLVTLVKGKDF